MFHCLIFGCLYGSVSLIKTIFHTVQLLRRPTDLHFLIPIKPDVTLLNFVDAFMELSFCLKLDVILPNYLSGLLICIFLTPVKPDGSPLIFFMCLYGLAFLLRTRCHTT